MDEDDPRAPGADERPGKTDQQIFDEQVARGTGTLVLIVAGVGIVAALVMSTIALVNSTSASHTTTVIAPAKASAGTSTARRSLRRSPAMRSASSSSSPATAASARSPAGRVTR